LEKNANNETSRNITYRMPWAPAPRLTTPATAVPFAFAVAALWGRRYDEWTKASLPWALITVVTLGCAILLGGYWAYVTLGWGGYWGWDPVENASLVPWIASAALVHGMILQRARGRFRKLNFSLAILAYVLVVYGTFLTRSGVLADFSVHSFVDLGITGWLVGNLAGAMVIGFGALIWRWREIPAEPGDEPFFSRTVFFVVAIAALLGTALTVLVGTSAPLITRLATKPWTLMPPSPSSRPGQCPCSKSAMCNQRANGSLLYRIRGIRYNGIDTAFADLRILTLFHKRHPSWQL